MDTQHHADGSDELGQSLIVTIRIAPDGRLYFNDITLDLLPVALSFRPDDPELLSRRQAAQAFAPRNHP